MERTLAEHAAEVLSRCATLMAIDGADPGAVAACQAAVEALQAGRPPELDEASTWGRIGRELIEGGSSPTYVAWTYTLPESILELARIPGFSPAHVRQLRDRMAIYSWFDLSMLLEGTADVPELPGELRAAASRYLQARQPLAPSVFLGVEGLAALQTLLAGWQAAAPEWHLYPVGDVALGRELLGQIDLVGADGPDRIATFLAFLAGFASLEADFPSPLARTLRFGENHRPRSAGPDVLNRGERHVAVRLPNGLPLRLELVAEDDLAAEIVRRRCSPAHWAQIAGGETVLPHYRDVFDLEAAFYRSRGLAYIPPELRDGPVDLAAWRAGSQHRLVSEVDVRGDLHMHTVWSDGKGAIADMVERALRLGYEYIAICEHSPHVRAANGLDPARLLAHRAEIEAINARFPGIQVLAGAEVDILPDGSLDYDDEVLARLDFVIASVHTAFDLEPAAQTARLAKAMQHPHVDLIGHMTGRILNNCPAYRLDLPGLIAVAAETGTALEINATPNRLDLPADAARLALAAGVMLAVNTDSHTPDGLAAMPLGISQARRAGAEPAQLINTMAWPRLRSWLQTPKAQRRSPA